MPRPLFHYLTERLSDSLLDQHIGGREQIPPEKKVALFLKYIGSHQTELEISQLFNIQESTLVKCRRQVSDAILQVLMPTSIKWPDIGDMPAISQGFNEGRYLFPDVIGAIDGSHIPISKPWSIYNPDAYYNRKQYHSVILQGVARDDCTFIDISVGVPGRVHDASALRKSSLWDTGANRCGNYHLLGDAAYPLTSWIMTPYRNNGHLTREQSLFNTVLSSKRQVIERTFGFLKSRFPRLRYGIHIINIDELNKVILAACCLHNISLPWDKGDFEDEEDALPVPPQPPQNVFVVQNAVNIQAQNKRAVLTDYIATHNI